MVEKERGKKVYCYDVDMVEKNTIREAQLYGENHNYTGNGDLFVGALAKGKLCALYSQGKKIANKKLLNDIKKKLGL